MEVPAHNGHAGGAAQSTWVWVCVSSTRSSRLRASDDRAARWARTSSLGPPAKRRGDGRRDQSCQDGQPGGAGDDPGDQARYGPRGPGPALPGRAVQPRRVVAPRRAHEPPRQLPGARRRPGRPRSRRKRVADAHSPMAATSGPMRAIYRRGPGPDTPACRSAYGRAEASAGGTGTPRLTSEMPPRPAGATITASTSGPLPPGGAAHSTK